jgi:hypothetical protein
MNIQDVFQGINAWPMNANDVFGCIWRFYGQSSHNMEIDMMDIDA